MIHRSRLVLSVVCVLGLLLWLRSGSEDATPTPDQPARPAVPAGVTEPTVAQVTEALDAIGEAEFLSVYALGEGPAAEHAIVKSPTFGLSPELPEELSDDPAVAEFADAAFRVQLMDDDALLQDMVKRGFDPAGELSDDPWHAVLTMEVARQISMGELDAFFTPGAEVIDNIKKAVFDKDADPGAVVDEAIEKIAEDAPYAPVPVELEAIAGEILRRFPDHPAADYARLQKLALATNKDSATEDVGQAKRLLAELLDGDTSPDIVQVALFRNTGNLARGAFAFDELDRIVGWMEQHPEVSPSVMAANMTARRMLNAGEHARAASWLALEQRAIAGACRNDVSRSCESMRGSSLRKQARLVAQEGVLPATWQTALVVEVQRCMSEHAVHRTVGYGQFGHGGWSWRRWEASSDLTRCVEGVAADKPTPPADQLVILELVPSGEDAMLLEARSRLEAVTP